MCRVEVMSHLSRFEHPVVLLKFQRDLETIHILVCGRQRAGLVSNVIVLVWHPCTYLPAIPLLWRGIRFALTGAL